MLNSSQERRAQKLLTERSRNQVVPQLVTARQLSKSKDVRNKLLMQARTQTQHHLSHNISCSGTDRKMESKNAQNLKIQSQLQQQMHQNEQLKTDIKELKSELQKTKQMNKALVSRLRQMENSYRTLREELEKNNQQDQRKIKVHIYSEVEEYIKVMVEKLTLNLKHEKMTIALEQKLQTFLTELLEINAATVQQFKKLNRQPQKSKCKDEPSSIIQINSFTQQSRATGPFKYTTQIKPQKLQLPTHENYSNIMQRLTGQSRMSQSYAVTDRGLKSSVSQDTKFRSIFAATPQKRKRIFQ